MPSPARIVHKGIRDKALYGNSVSFSHFTLE